MPELNEVQNEARFKSSNCCDSSNVSSTTPEEIKQAVQERYSSVIATHSCGCSCNTTDSLIEGYDKLEGYTKTADYGLGCGIPTEFANIQIGDTVLDLGSGAGNDVFVARAIVGEEGRVIGIDFTDEMIKKANENKEKTGFSNVEFRKGDIEAMPVEDNSIDVIISNCVINLVPDKKKAFSEIYRVLKPGGHFCISDMVVNGHMQENLRKDLALYAGCIAGAVSQDEYLKMLHEIGFTNPEIKKATQVITSREQLDGKYSTEKAGAMWDLADKLFSITFYAVK
jgi:ubiquinone/menaquinone biosynthesis C-methylase UbiE